MSAQTVINCYAGGSCNGGNPGQVYEFANTHGLNHASCMNYEAKNDVAGDCQDIDVCRDCSWPPPAEGESSENCVAITDYKKYYVSEYYDVSGADAMKAELLNGPISCGVHATDAWVDNYRHITEGVGDYIYSEDVRFVLLNHEISVTGYGKDETTGQEYWIGRNSWGTYWGDHGFFYIAMGGDNLGIERNCIAGVPSYEKPSVTAANKDFGIFTQ